MKSIKNIVNTVLLVCLLSLMPGACRQKEDRVISQNKMVEVLTDVYLTEALLQNVDKKKKADWSKGLADNYFQDLAYRIILEKHGISEDVFYNSVARYSKQYKVYAKIYARVELNLQALQADVAKLDEIRTEAARLAQEHARLIAALDTASYIRWFEVWSPDTLGLSDTLGLWSDSLFIPLQDTCQFFRTAFWFKPLSSDTIVWTMLDKEMSEDAEIPEDTVPESSFKEKIKPLTKVLGD